MYGLEGTFVVESPWTESIGGRTAFVRQIELVTEDPSRFTLQLGTFGPHASLVERDGVTFAVCGDGTPVCIALTGTTSSSLGIGSDGLVTATLPATKDAARFDVLMWRGDVQQLSACAAA